MSSPEPPQATPEPEQPRGLAARLQLQHRAGASSQRF